VVVADTPWDHAPKNGSGMQEFVESINRSRKKKKEGEENIKIIAESKRLCEGPCSIESATAKTGKRVGSSQPRGIRQKKNSWNGPLFVKYNLRLGRGGHAG